MTHTTFCDSSGLHTLLRAYKRLASEAGGLRLVIPADGAVPRILTLTGLNRLIPCYRSVAAAVAGPPAPMTRSS
jgi:anti-anti-sigma factor